MTVVFSSTLQLRHAELEQQQLARFRIASPISSVEAAGSGAVTNAGELDTYQSNFGLDADPDERFTAASTPGGGLNRAGWSNKAFDSLIQEIRRVYGQRVRTSRRTIGE